MGGCCSCSESGHQYDKTPLLIDSRSGFIFPAGSATTVKTQRGDLAFFRPMEGTRGFKLAPMNSHVQAGPLLKFPLTVVATPEHAKGPKVTDKVTQGMWDIMNVSGQVQGAEQLLFIGIVQCMTVTVASKTTKNWSGALVLTGLGRLMLIAIPGCCGSWALAPFASIHACALQSVTLLQPGSVSLESADLQISELVTTAPAALALVRALHMLVTAAYVGSNPPTKFNLSGGELDLSAMPLPGLDGGFHSAYTIWHNYFAPFGDPDYEPEVVCPGQARRQDRYALSAVREALTTGELDISTWDKTATAAAAASLKFNYVFRALKAHIPEVTLGEDATTATKLNSIADALKHSKALVKIDLATSESSANAQKLLREAEAAIQNAIATCVQGVAQAAGAVCQALEANPALALMDLRLRHLPVGAGVAPLVQFVSKLRPYTMATVHLAFLGVEPHAAQQLVSALAPQAASLEELDLSGCPLHTAGGELAALFSQAPKLATVVLPRSNISAGLSSIQGQWLRTLDLSDNVVTQELMDTVFRLLPTLTQLKLAGCLQLQAPPEFLLQLMQRSAGLPLLLDLSRNPQALRAAFPHISQMLTSKSHPQGLGLSASQLGDDGVTLVCNSLVGNAVIKRLDVSSNLADAPIYLPRLVELLELCTRCPDFSSAVQMYQQFSPPEMATRFHTATAVANVMAHGTMQEMLLAGDPRLGSAFGCMLAMPLHLGLSVNSTLTSLDIENNRMGDVGAIALGAALRRNRTLTALRWDGNGIMLDGLRAFRGCLYGNKKLVEVPFANRDMAAILQKASQLFLDSLNQEYDARVLLKRSYAGRKGRYEPTMHARAMSQLKAAKGTQAEGRVLKEQARKVAAGINASLARNKTVSDLKGSIKQAKLFQKNADMYQRMAEKSKGTLAAKQSKFEMRVWEARHKAMLTWRKAVAAAKKEGGKDISWFNLYCNSWDKNFLTMQAMMALWDKIPQDQRAHFEKTYLSAQETLSVETNALAQLSELQESAMEQQEMAAFHLEVQQKLVEHSQSGDPKQIPLPDMDPGIINTKAPGVHEHNQFGSGRYTDWTSRYTWIMSSLLAGLRFGPPPDYTWEPVVTPGCDNRPPMAPMEFVVPRDPTKTAPTRGAPPGGESTFLVPGSVPAAYGPSPPNPVPTPATGFPPGRNDAQMGYPVSNTSQAVSGAQQAGPKPAGYKGGVIPSFNPAMQGGAAARIQGDVHNSRRIGSSGGGGYGRYGAYGAFGTFGAFGAYGMHGMYGRHGNYGRHHHHHHHNNSHYQENSAPEQYQDDGTGAVSVDQEAQPFSEVPATFDDSRYEPELGEEAAVEMEDVDMGDDGDAEAEGMDMYGGAGPQDLPGSGGNGTGGAHKGVRCGDRNASPWARKSPAHMWCNRQLLKWFDGQWAQQLANVERDVMGRTQAVETRAVKRICPADVQPQPLDITVVTQCSVDRLPRLQALASAWAGPVSAAVYVDGLPGSQEEADVISKVLLMHNALKKLDAHGVCRVDVGIMYKPMVDERARSFEYDQLYPINALRNLALDQARTEMVFLLDVDFVPSEGLHASMAGKPATLQTTLLEGQLIVIPAFELNNGSAAQTVASTGKAALQSLYATGEASAFHVGHFPAGHSPTNFDKWFDSEQGYQVSYSDFYEPYVVAAKSRIPHYDERFRGYGMNKVSHLFASAAAGLGFTVWPSHFVCAEEHDKSSSWQSVFGQAAQAMHRMRVALLYQRFKCFVQSLPGTCDPVHSSGSDMAVHADQGNLMLSDMAVRATRHDYFSAQAARAELLRPLTTMNPSALKQNPRKRQLKEISEGTYDRASSGESERVYVKRLCSVVARRSMQKHAPTCGLVH